MSEKQTMDKPSSVTDEKNPSADTCGATKDSVEQNRATADVSSVREISLIENMTSFLQANGGDSIDGKVLRTIAEALSKKWNDTSPGTLQDVTMEHSYGIGYRSPCVSLQQSHGNTSPPVQGRSVREFEEQMASLRKENFNLKLRLYFLEESVPGYQQTNAEGQETLMKQLIDAKVEMEILRKEIQEKQEILKEAAQAMNQMEQIQKETEAKSQAVIDELNQKVQFLEMERDVGKSHNGGFMNDLLGRSDISENVNALQKIRELEGMVKHSEERIGETHQQIAQLEDVLAKRDEAIKEYEEKVKELVFQNAELLETVEGKERDVAKAESTISVKTANTARLLERIQDYEKMVTKVNFERNLAKRENRFFRAIINKLQHTNKNEYYTIEKEQIFKQIGTESDDKFADLSKHLDLNYNTLNTHGDYHSEYTLKHKLCVNLCNSGKCTSSDERNAGCSGVGGAGGAGDIVENYIDEFSRDEGDIEPEFPIRYTISDASLFAGPGTSRTDSSCSSLQANFSSSILVGPEEASCLSDNIVKSQRLCEELREQKAALADKICMLEEVEEKLKNRTQLHEQACRTIRKLMQVLKSHQEEINRLKEQNDTEANSKKNNDDDASSSAVVTASGLECTGLCRNLSDSEAFNEVYGAQKQKYEAIIEEQENSIKTLKTEVKKKTAALQNLVNNELWEKNREIERLTKLINNNSGSAAAANLSNVELHQSFTEAEYTKALKHNKLLQRKCDVLNQRLGTEQSSAEIIAQLRKDVRNARSEAENAEKWRRECADVCQVLSTRLEELAGFLNSLLKHRDVLGFLAADRRRAMRNAVNTSLDLSKSLNVTLSIGDHSLTQLSNISCILAEAEGEINDTKTFNSHDHACVRHSMVTLQAENKALKKELEQRRNTDPKKERRSLPPLMIDNQSESEAWSEPDRKVSLARIGLDDHSTSLAKEQSQAAPADTDSESDAGVLQQSRTSKTRSQERITQLEQMIAERDERILSVQCQLVETDNCVKKETLRVIDLTRELEEVRQRNEQLYADIIAIGSEDSSDDGLFSKTLLQQEIEEKRVALEKARDERERITVEARLAEVQIGALKADLEDLKLKYERELALTDAQTMKKLEELRIEMERLSEVKLSEQEKSHKNYIQVNYIERSIYEDLKAQLAALQTQYTEAQRTIDYFTESEQELKQTLVESELAARALKKQLDESTLQASKVIMERTKICNEKLQLEKRLQELLQQTKEQEKECNTLLQRIADFEHTQKSLNEQMARASNTGNTERGGGGSETWQSGYTSEEVLAMGQRSGMANVNAAKRENNFSPDLGIESDAGRVSSVELSNVQQSLLKIVEVPTANSPSKDTNKAADFDSNGENDMKIANTLQPSGGASVAEMARLHDCIKVEQENAELRRKLIRTKRAFEDTYEKLRVANQRKARVEREIKNQIVQTHSVLKNVRSNMED